MFKFSQTASMRTLVLFVVLVPVIVYLLHFAYRKNTESTERTLQCQLKCSGEGYPGYDFRWAMLSEPKCECLGDPEVK
jgi:hypothetical protein